MRRKLFLSLITAFVCTLLFAFSASAEKIITLNDGSSLKGEVLQFSEGTYTIKTSNLGEIEIPENNVLSIVDDSVKQLESANNPKAEFQAQVQELQEELLNDPAMMQEVEGLLEDEEITSILSDQELLDDVLSLDPEKIQNNPKVQELLNNPRMQNFLNATAEKISN